MLEFFSEFFWTKNFDLHAEQVVYPLLPTVMPETSSLLLRRNHNAGLCVVCTCCVFTELCMQIKVFRPEKLGEKL
jgi:hypothetical protein